MTKEIKAKQDIKYGDKTVKSGTEDKLVDYKDDGTLTVKWEDNITGKCDYFDIEVVDK